VVVEATQTVGDAELGAEDESCALVEHNSGEVEGCHQILRWMLDEHPYLACQLSVFYRTPINGYPRGGEFAGRVSPRSGTRKCKGTQGLDRFGLPRA
jgi:hypothetical protein